MHTTSVSLLRRLAQPGAADAWERFVRLYAPLLTAWAARAGLQPADADDLTQDVLLLLHRKLPTFRYDRDGSFRAWLWTVARNAWRTRMRRPAPRPATEAELHDLPDPDDPDDLTESEYRRHLVGRAAQLIQADFQPATWKAFWECTAAGRSAEEVAPELGITPGAVRAAKFRVLARLRQELDGLLD